MLAFAMPAGFTREDIESLASLARVELSPAELDAFGRQLSEVLEYARQVQQVDTEGIPPTSGLSARLDREEGRDDELRPSMARGDALANAPDPAREAGLFKVPRVLG